MTVIKIKCTFTKNGMTKRIENSDFYLIIMNFSFQNIINNIDDIVFYFKVCLI